MPSSCMEEKHLENKNDKCFPKFYDKLKMVFNTRVKWMVCEKNMCFSCISLSFSCQENLQTKKRGKLPYFQTLLSLRFNFWKESKTNRHLPTFLNSANICFQSIVSKNFSFMFPPSWEAMYSQVKLFLWRPVTITIVWR